MGNNKSFRCQNGSLAKGRNNDRMEVGRQSRKESGFDHVSTNTTPLVFSQDNISRYLNASSEVKINSKILSNWPQVIVSQHRSILSQARIQSRQNLSNEVLATNTGYEVRCLRYIRLPGIYTVLLINTVDRVSMSILRIRFLISFSVCAFFSPSDCLILLFSVFLIIYAIMTFPVSRVAVIGAGVSGVLAAKYLKEEGIEVVVFERSRKAGGNW